MHTFVLSIWVRGAETKTKQNEIVIMKFEESHQSDSQNGSLSIL